MYLVDTSIWIPFLRGNNTPKVKFLEALLTEGEAAICEVVFAEICFGARDEIQFKKYEEMFSGIPFLKLPVDWHLLLAKWGYLLRKKGTRPFVADTLIALTAFHHQVTLLQEDSDFLVYSKLFGLHLE